MTSRQAISGNGGREARRGPGQRISREQWRTRPGTEEGQSKGGGQMAAFSFV